MFGFGKSGKTAPDQQVVDRLVKDVRQELDKMRSTTPEEAERIHQRLKERLKDDRLPLDFRRQAGSLARKLECNANTRAVARALNWAATFARAEKMADRSKSVQEARRYLSKAIQLGAGNDFRRASEREIEAIMLSGGVVKKGPSRAKPIDSAPKNPRSAKL